MLVRINYDSDMTSNDYGRNHSKLTKKADLMINTLVVINFLDSDTTNDHMVVIFSIAGPETRYHFTQKLQRMSASSLIMKFYV